MSGTQTGLITSLVFIGLFSIAIIGFALNFAIDNDASVDISNGNVTSQLYSQAKGNFSNLETDSESIYTSIKGTTIEPGSDVVQSVEEFTIGWGSLYDTFKNVINIPRQEIFGGREGGFNFFFTVLVSLLGFLFAIYLIKTLRGNP